MKMRETEDKLEATEAFFHMAKYLTSSPQYIIPVVPGQNPEEEMDKHRWQRNITSHMLYVIIFENSIKILWELENEEECEHTHNIIKIYGDLNDDTRRKVVELYKNAVTRFSKIAGTMQGLKITLADMVEFASLEQALKSNKTMMINFKYDNKFEGKTSAVGNSVRNEETLWILPAGQKPFTETLFEYVRERCS